jgi:hypothetical protein
MTNKTLFIVIGSSVAAGVLGFVGGYFVGSRRMKKATDDIISQMNDEINDYVAQLTGKETEEKVVVEGIDYTKSEAYAKAKELAKKNEELKKSYLQKIREQGYSNPVYPISPERRQQVKEEIATMTDEEREEFIETDFDDEERKARNAEMGLESDEDYEERMADEIDVVADNAIHNPLPPYIIDENEYMDDQFDAFTKQVFTYFGDGTLIDEGDDIVPEAEDLVGVDNLIELESGNEDRIFVRNEKYAADYEIIFKEMSYNEYMGNI